MSRQAASCSIARPADHELNRFARTSPEPLPHDRKYPNPGQMGQHTPDTSAISSPAQPAPRDPMTADDDPGAGVEYLARTGAEGPRSTYSRRSTRRFGQGHQAPFDLIHVLLDVGK